VKYILFLFIPFSGQQSLGQNVFTSDPLKAKFITVDISNFWVAFDKIDEKRNPFIEYLENGSKGLIDFIPNRIESPKKLLKIVQRRYPDYLAIRDKSMMVGSYTEQLKLSYISFLNLYEKAIFPPTYFVIGAFNTGGTVSENGLIIGVEKQDKIDMLPNLVAHELIHFNQNYPRAGTTLIKQSIVEGSADFIGELISGNHPNEEAHAYGQANEEQLCAEFVKIMDGTSYKGWLYGSNGKKKGRPKDLGYWIGYKICKAFYSKTTDKNVAISEILNIKDFNKFLVKSEYLSKYITRELEK